MEGRGRSSTFFPKENHISEDIISPEEVKILWRGAPKRLARSYSEIETLRGGDIDPSSPIADLRCASRDKSTTSGNGVCTAVFPCEFSTTYW